LAASFRQLVAPNEGSRVHFFVARAHALPLRFHVPSVLVERGHIHSEVCHTFFVNFTWVNSSVESVHNFRMFRQEYSLFSELTTLSASQGQHRTSFDEILLNSIAGETLSSS
jgi:hypothetical protein